MAENLPDSHENRSKTRVQLGDCSLASSSHPPLGILSGEVPCAYEYESELSLSPLTVMEDSELDKLEADCTELLKQDAEILPQEEPLEVALQGCETSGLGKREDARESFSMTTETSASENQETWDEEYDPTIETATSKGDVPMTNTSLTKMTGRNTAEGDSDPVFHMITGLATKVGSSDGVILPRETQVNAENHEVHFIVCLDQLMSAGQMRYLLGVFKNVLIIEDPIGDTVNNEIFSHFEVTHFAIPIYFIGFGKACHSMIELSQRAASDGMRVKGIISFAGEIHPARFSADPLRNIWYCRNSKVYVKEASLDSELFREECYGNLIFSQQADTWAIFQQHKHDMIVWIKDKALITLNLANVVALKEYCKKVVVELIKELGELRCTDNMLGHDLSIFVLEKLL